MLIAQISDTHILPPGWTASAAGLRVDCLRTAVTDINTQQPDAVIFTGDTVQHGQDDEYEQLRELLEPLEAPLYLVPGNRDEKNAMRTAFSDHTHLSGAGDFLHYVIDDYETRLIGIDSTLAGERKGRFCRTRQDWLDATLGEKLDSPTLLFIHHPPFDVGDHYIGGYRHQEESAALSNIVQRHDQVIGLLCGHVHWSIAREWAGTEARITPSVAIDLRKGIDEVSAQGRPLYMLHRASCSEGLVSETRFAGPPVTALQMT